MSTAGEFLSFDFSNGLCYALGMTYVEHQKEIGENTVLPPVFMKRCAASPAASELPMPSPPAIHDALQPLDPVLTRELSSWFPRFPVLLDYEVEIGMALLEDISLADLDLPGHMPRVGYFVANDATARSIQMAGEGSEDRLHFWEAAKGFKGFLPVSPRIWCPAHTLDILPECTLRTFVNGELRQQASSTRNSYSPRQMLKAAAALAPGGRLFSGDKVLTGTPSGVALSIPSWKRHIAMLMSRPRATRAGWRGQMKNPRFLTPGDEVILSADWLGEIRLHVTSA